MSGDSPNGAADRGIPEDLWPAYYEELHAIARSLLRGEPRSPSLAPTLVLNEALVRVLKDGLPQQESKAYFICSVVRSMRRYLIDRGRRRRLERGAVAQLRDAASLLFADAGRAPEACLDVNLAIEEFAQSWPRAARVVEFRCGFAFSVAQTADALGIAERTVKADWKFARTWLFERLGGDSTAGRVNPHDRAPVPQ